MSIVAGRRPRRTPRRLTAGSRVREYLLTLVVAATVTYLLTPVARRIALRWGAMTAVRDRDVHAIPTPRLGGIAMLGGFGAGMLVATQMPFLGPRLGDGRADAARCSSGAGPDLPARRRRRQVGAGRADQARRAGARRRASWCIGGVQMLYLPIGGFGGDSVATTARSSFVLGPVEGDGAHHRARRRHGERGELRRRPGRARRRHRRHRRRGVLRLLLPAHREREPDPRDHRRASSRQP